MQRQWILYKTLPLHVKELIQANQDQSLLFDERECVVVDRFNKTKSDACLFAMKAEDNSMQPQLDMGDIVIVEIDRMPNPGDKPTL